MCLIFSCSDQLDDSWKENMDEITRLNCRATKLRKARFALADSIRFYQDSLREYGHSDAQNAHFWETSLATMDKRKKWLAETSRNLSDSIHAELLTLTLEMSVEEKRIFNDSLQAKTEDLDCM